jgi:hypothetical protein
LLQACISCASYKMLPMQPPVLIVFHPPVAAPAAAAAAAILCTADLHQLRQLSMGWCRDLGDTSSDASNSVAALASLTLLSSLSLAGTGVDDAQLVLLLPKLQQLQVRHLMNVDKI